MPAFRQFPALVVLMLVGTGLMLVPAAHAAHLKNWDVARTFLYHAVFFAILATILGIATSNWTPRHPARYHLMTLLVTYMVLPWMLGAPLVPLVPILSVIACGWLMLNLSLETWFRFVCWMALGVLVYFLYSKNHSLVGKRERGEVIESLAD